MPSKNLIPRRCCRGQCNILNLTNLVIKTFKHTTIRVYSVDRITAAVGVGRQPMVVGLPKRAMSGA